MTMLVVAGAGGQGRESLAWVLDAFPDRPVHGFVDSYVTEDVCGHAVIGGLAWLEDVEEDIDVVIGIGGSGPRRMLVDVAGARENVHLLTVIHPTAYIGPHCTIGAGAVVAPNVTLTRDCLVGTAAIINFGAQIGHDALIGSASFVGPGASLGGNVTVGDGAWVGIGATVLQGIHIGRDAVVGAGATVIRDVPDGVTVVGTPARVLAPERPDA